MTIKELGEIWDASIRVRDKRIAELEAAFLTLICSLSRSAKRIEELEAELAALRKDRERIAELEAQLESLQDQLADRDHDLLSKFDPRAAESTDLYTWITCLLAKRERLNQRINELEAEVQRLTFLCNRLNQQNDALEIAIEEERNAVDQDKIRNAALEEAAVLCESMPGSWQLASYIRAMKREEK